MIIETKFSCGDVVFHASYKSAPDMHKCESCAGSGRLRVEGHALTVACFECHGYGEISKGCKFLPACNRMTVGQVGVEITDSPGLGNSSFDNYKPQSGREERYMCNETGVGCGSLYDVENLFHTEAEAMERAAWIAADVQQRDTDARAEDERKRAQYAAREFQDEAEVLP